LYLFVLLSCSLLPIRRRKGTDKLN
jgi:hypothetical protein